LFSRSDPGNSTEVQLATLIHLISSYLGIKGDPGDYMVTSGYKKEETSLSGAALDSYIKGMT